MNCGSFQQAITCFEEGLLILQHSNRPEFASYIKSQGHRSSQRKSEEGERDKKIIRIANIPGTFSWSRPEQGFALFSGALTFSAVVNDLPIGHSEFFLHLVSAVLTYNIGLSYHVAGLEFRDPTLLSLATRCYINSQFKLNCLVKSFQAMDCSVWFSICFLALANNLGHVYSRHCDYERMDSCVNEVSSRLTKLAESSHATLYSHSELSTFHLNLVLFRQSLSQLAPAA